MTESWAGPGNEASKYCYFPAGNISGVCGGSWQTAKQHSNSHEHKNELWTDSDAFSDALSEESQSYHTPPTKHHRQKKHKSKHGHKSKCVPARDTLSLPEHDTFSDVLSQDFPSYLPGHASDQGRQPGVERFSPQPVQTHSVSKSKRSLESQEGGVNDIHSTGGMMRPEGVRPQSTSKKRKGRKSTFTPQLCIT